MAMQKDSQDKCEEKQDGVHNPQSPRCLQHGAVLVEMERPRRSAASAIVAKRTQVDVDGSAGEVGAIGVTDASQLPVSCNEGADEAEVDECDKESRAAGRPEADEGHDGPCAGEDGDDKEDEDEGWGELVILIEAVDEPCQHANDGNQCHDFDDSPEGEE